MSIEERIAAAMEAADERDGLIGWDCYADEAIVDWSALAAAVVAELGLTEDAFTLDGCVRYVTPWEAS